MSWRASSAPAVAVSGSGRQDVFWQATNGRINHVWYTDGSWHQPVDTGWSIHPPLLGGCGPSGSSYVFHGSTSRHAVALTFDDGPWTQTPQFLDVLEREHVPATFFQTGQQISTYGNAIELRMIADGDMIANHGWDHANLSADGSLAAGQIWRTNNAIRSATGGFTPCLFRAPGGNVSAGLIAQARAMGFITVQWDVDPRDWERPGATAIYQRVISNTHNGAISIQHDGGGDRSQTLAALPREIDALRNDGYQIVTVAQLLGLRPIYK
jgi:peptidoglycan/xylan/chitin deacetylase (PgdA/CDA1 family)